MANTSIFAAFPLTNLEIPSLFFPRRISVKNTSIISFTETHFLPQSISTSIVRSLTPRGIGSVSCSSVTDEASSEELQVRTLTWNWKGYSIRYQCAGTSGPALVLVHGFGANSDHWRKNIPILGKLHRVYSIDLIGYGYSDKPNPREFGGEPFYTFETWSEQLNDICLEIVKDEAFFYMQLYWRSCWSSGSSKQATAMQRPYAHKHIAPNTPVGKLFFKSIATPETVKSILCQDEKPEMVNPLIESFVARH